jgi:hypothetical protein
VPGIAKFSAILHQSDSTSNIRYRDEVMCLAARIISALRDRAKKNVRGNVNGLFDAIHIRSKLFFLILLIQFALLLN